MSELPSGWTVQTLENIASHVTSGGTPTSGSSRYYVEHGGLPFAKTEDLSATKTKYIDRCELNITDVALGETAAKRYPPGTVLLSMYGTIGLTKIAAIEMAANQALCAMIPPFSCNVGYLYQHLEHFRVNWLKYSGQTTQANINGATVRAHHVPLPPLIEQAKIAQILDTLDTAIAQTEAIIAKLKAVKQGLLHDLLTRGIDAKGELRPPQSEAPQLYKQSALGWIPKEWEVELLDEISVRGSGHTPSKSSPSYWNGGIKWVSLADSHRLDDIYIYDTDKEISALGLANSSAVLHPAGTVILSRDAGIGKSAVLASDMAVSQHFIAWRCGPRLNNLFLYFWLQHEKRHFESIAFGSTILTIGLPFFKGYKVVVPHRAEQEKTAAILMNAEANLASESKGLDKLRNYKIGLMDDLLTGNVRVTPLLTAAA